MSVVLSVASFVAGLGLVVFFAEKLVKGAVGVSSAFGISTFLISVLFIGFDPENLAVGVSGNLQGVGGVVLGSVIGAAMVAIGFAFGLTAAIVPLRFSNAPKAIVAMPVAAVALFSVLAWDGTLSRIDGGILLLAFVAAIGVLIYLSRRGVDVKPTGEVAESLQKLQRPTRWRSLSLLVVSLAAIFLGSELLVGGARSIIDRFGLRETFFGMVVVSFLVSIEEVARELPAALKGRPEITYGNVVGSALAFFCFNGGIIALVSPIDVPPAILRFYLPVCAVTVTVVALFVAWGRVPRWAGLLLAASYLVFVIGGYLRFGAEPST